jgi:hypothetical protein
LILKNVRMINSTYGGGVIPAPHVATRRETPLAVICPSSRNRLFQLVQTGA